MTTSDSPPPGPLTRRELRALREQAAGIEASHVSEERLVLPVQPDVPGEGKEFVPLPSDGAIEPGDHEPQPMLDEEPYRGERSKPDALTPPLTESEPSWAPETENQIADALQLSQVGEGIPETRHASALAWVTPTHFGRTPPREEDLLAGVPRPARVRASVVVPILGIMALIAAYAVTMILWPLNKVPPQIQVIDFATVTSPEADITWPEAASAAVGISHIGIVASDEEAARLAGVVKLVSSLMVLDRLPLALGETGEDLNFTQQDRTLYNAYVRRGQTVLDIPVGGVLTQHQLLQGALIGSADNYIDRLMTHIWGSNDVFQVAAAEWLEDRGLSGITIVDASGWGAGSMASPADVIHLAELAMANPVIREIVGTAEVELPAAGLVHNTNPLLLQEGVTGVKTGILGDAVNLVAAKTVEHGGTTVQLFVAMRGQPSAETRNEAIEALFAQLEEMLRTQPATVPAGSLVGKVSTPWGETADAITDADAGVVLWNGSSARVQSEVGITWDFEDRQQVGTLTVIGPLDVSTVTVSVATPLQGPDIWWRLTHPLQLLGLDQ